MEPDTVLVISEDPNWRTDLVKLIEARGHRASGVPLESAKSRLNELNATVVVLAYDASSQTLIFHAADQLAAAQADLRFLLIPQTPVSALADASSLATALTPLLAQRPLSPRSTSRTEPLIEELRRVSRSLRRSDAHSNVAERLLQAVLEPALQAVDPKTLNVWAHTAGISSTTLRELCHLAGLKPNSLRTFSRALLLAHLYSVHGPWAVSALDISDRRTLKKLLGAAGLVNSELSAEPSVEQFLEDQTVIPGSNHLIAEFRRRVVSGN